MSEAAAFGPEPGLLIDGFPRHPEQLPLAEELFPDWSAIYLDIPVPAAVSRLRNRLVCGSCGSVKLAGADPQRPCPVCGAATWRTRIEDDDSGIPRRVSEFERYLRPLLQALNARRIIRVDAEQTVEKVADLAVSGLMRTRRT